ncbi:outer membrane protein assembly factor BamC [Kerstersia similis]|uniref:outer membrane protein assembly factor BamC n=1 Tax=Kerstersia similis TaxID=206505 RepID=UPI0039F00138
MNKGRLAVPALTLAVVLAGCSSVNELLGNEESIDYKGASSNRTKPLSIPPDLTQAASDPRYQMPASGSTTFTAFQQQGAEAAQAKPLGPNVLPEFPGLRIVRDGDRRWLEADASPSELYPRIVTFWEEQGFPIASNDPAVGIIQTGWAENRAKIPESGLRNLLGRIIDQVWDSGERERFRTRLERIDGRTEIFISHDHMFERNVGHDDARVKWEVGPESPELNAAMLSRMMVYLGGGDEEAMKKAGQLKAEEAAAADNAAKAAPAAVALASGADMLEVPEPFDRAWRRVGMGLDSAGFTVDDRDRAAGEYFVRYADIDSGMKSESANFFTRLFRTSPDLDVQVYRLRLQQVGDLTQVYVVDDKGNKVSDGAARRLLTVLKDKL